MSRRLRPALFAALFVLVACGDDDADTTTAGTTAGTADTEPVTEDSADTGSTADDSATGDLYGGPGGETTTTTTAGDDDTGATTDAAPITTASSEYGELLVDADGFTLYGFTNDADGIPTCTDGCADTWPPLLLESADLPAGLDPAVFSVVEHPSDQFQLSAGDWPLYRYSPDEEAGATSGQGVGGVWFVVDPQGELIRE